MGFRDSGYTGVEKREEIRTKHPQVKFIVAAKRGKIQAMKEGPLKEATVQLEKVKAQVRAVVGASFSHEQNLFRHRKARYRGLAKNLAQLQTLFALANLVLAKRALLA